MSAIEIREEVHELVNQLDDKLLTAVHAMLESYIKQEDLTEEGVIGYEIDGTPITVGYAMVEYRHRIEEVKKGNYISLEDLEAEAEQW